MKDPIELNPKWGNPRKSGFVKGHAPIPSPYFHPNPLLNEYSTIASLSFPPRASEEHCYLLFRETLAKKTKYFAGIY